MRVARLVVLLLSAAGLLACDGGSGGGSGGPVDPDFGVHPLADVIEAIFLGTGPFANGGCASPGVWTGYEMGTTPEVLITASVTGGARPALEAAVADLAGAIGGFHGLSATFSNRSDEEPALFEIVATVRSDTEIDQLCLGADGCFFPVVMSPPNLGSGKIYLRRSPFEGRVAAHELGHGIGLCHLAEGSVEEAIMAFPIGTGGDAFSGVELQAVQAVFQSGLQPGATRADFQAANLVR